MRILGVDPGERRIGIAISDPEGIVARSLEVLHHRTLPEDVERIADLARSHQAARIIVGVATDSEGEAGPQARRALRLAEALRARSQVPVETWDESFSTQDVLDARLEGGVRGAHRRQNLDAAAAAAILQGYLDAHSQA